MALAVSRRVRVEGELGLHLRAAGALVQLASRYGAEISIGRDDATANAKSIMSVLSLAAGRGAWLTVSATGADAQAAVDALVGLVAAGFVAP